MKCYACGGSLTWGGDHDTEGAQILDEGRDPVGHEHAIVTNLSCQECGAFVLVYWGDLTTLAAETLGNKE